MSNEFFYKDYRSLSIASTDSSFSTSPSINSNSSFLLDNLLNLPYSPIYPPSQPQYYTNQRETPYSPVLRHQKSQIKFKPGHRKTQSSHQLGELVNNPQISPLYTPFSPVLFPHSPTTAMSPVFNKYIPHYSARNRGHSNDHQLRRQLSPISSMSPDNIEFEFALIRLPPIVNNIPNSPVAGGESKPKGRARGDSFSINKINNTSAAVIASNEVEIKKVGRARGDSFSVSGGGNGGGGRNKTSPYMKINALTNSVVSGGGDFGCIERFKNPLISRQTRQLPQQFNQLQISMHNNGSNDLMHYQHQQQQHYSQQHQYHQDHSQIYNSYASTPMDHSHEPPNLSLSTTTSNPSSTSSSTSSTTTPLTTQIKLLTPPNQKCQNLTFNLTPHDIQLLKSTPNHTLRLTCHSPLTSHDTHCWPISLLSVELNDVGVEFSRVYQVPNEVKGGRADIRGCDEPLCLGVGWKEGVNFVGMRWAGDGGLGEGDGYLVVVEVVRNY